MATNIVTNILPRKNTRRKETWEVSEVIKCDKGIIFKRPKGRFPFFEKKKNNAQSMNFYKISEIITYKISEISTVRKKRKQQNRNNLNRTDLNFSWNFYFVPALSLFMAVHASRCDKIKRLYISHSAVTPRFFESRVKRDKQRIPRNANVNRPFPLLHSSKKHEQSRNCKFFPRTIISSVISSWFYCGEKSEEKAGKFSLPGGVL